MAALRNRVMTFGKEVVSKVGGYADHQLGAREMFLWAFSQGLIHIVGQKELGIDETGEISPVLGPRNSDLYGVKFTIHDDSILEGGVSVSVVDRNYILINPASDYSEGDSEVPKLSKTLRWLKTLRQTYGDQTEFLIPFAESRGKVNHWVLLSIKGDTCTLRDPKRKSKYDPTQIEELKELLRICYSQQRTLEVKAVGCQHRMDPNSCGYFVGEMVREAICEWSENHPLSDAYNLKQRKKEFNHKIEFAKDQIRMHCPGLLKFVEQPKPSLDEEILIAAVADFEEDGEDKVEARREAKDTEDTTDDETESSRVSYTPSPTTSTSQIARSSAKNGKPIQIEDKEIEQNQDPYSKAYDEFSSDLEYLSQMLEPREADSEEPESKQYDPNKRKALYQYACGIQNEIQALMENPDNRENKECYIDVMKAIQASLVPVLNPSDNNIPNAKETLKKLAKRVKALDGLDENKKTHNRFWSLLIGFIGVLAGAVVCAVGSPFVAAGIFIGSSALGGYLFFKSASQGSHLKLAKGINHYTNELPDDAEPSIASRKC